MSCEVFGLLATIGRFIYLFQTLIAGFMAAAAAVYALGPVYRQLHLANTQTVIARRDIIRARLKSTEANRVEAQKIFGEALRYLSQAAFEAEEAETNMTVDPHTAHGEEQGIRLALLQLKNQQLARMDSIGIDPMRAAVELCGEELADCLEAIHRPHSIDFGDIEGFTEAQSKAAENEALEASKKAKSELPSRIAALEEAERALRAAFDGSITELRDRLRTMEESIVSDEDTVPE